MNDHSSFYLLPFQWFAFALGFHSSTCINAYTRITVTRTLYLMQSCYHISHILYSFSFTVLCTLSIRILIRFHLLRLHLFLSLIIYSNSNYIFCGIINCVAIISVHNSSVLLFHVPTHKLLNSSTKLNVL